MAIKIMSVQIAAADIAAQTANISYYIDRKGKLQSCGSPSPNTATVYPLDPLDLSPYGHVKVTLFSGVQTGAVGGSFQIVELWPNAANVATTAVTALNPSPFVQAIAATATTFSKDIVDSAATGVLTPIKMFLASPILFWTTPPSPATPIFLEIWGQTAVSQYG